MSREAVVARQFGMCKDIARLEQRHAHLSARDHNPRRWSRRTRNWNFIDVVTLNPERDPVAHDAHQASDKPALAA